MKKILIVVCSYFPIIGGAQTQAQLFAEAMSKKGYCVEVFTKLSKPDLPKKELINGVFINRYKDNLVSLCFLLFKKGVGFDVVFFLGFLRNSSRSIVFAQLLTSLLLKAVFGKEIWLQPVSTVEKYRDNLFKSLLVKKLLTAVSLFLPISSEQMQYLKENLSIEEAKLISPLELPGCSALLGPCGMAMIGSSRFCDSRCKISMWEALRKHHKQNTT